MKTFLEYQKGQKKDLVWTGSKDFNKRTDAAYNKLRKKGKEQGLTDKEIYRLIDLQTRVYGDAPDFEFYKKKLGK